MTIQDGEQQTEIELVKANTTLSRGTVQRELDDFVEEAEGQLTVDVFQTPTEFVIQSTVAGVEPEDLDVAITSESATIRGRREHSEKVKEEDYIYQECYWGKFSRSVMLPREIDTEHASALVKNGILTVRLPKLDKEKTKKIKVRAD